MVSVICLVAGHIIVQPVAAATPAPAPGKSRKQVVTGSATALEGDRLAVAGRTVRLMGIDAPDPGQTCDNRFGSSYDCFAVSKAVLAALVVGKEVTCVITDRSSSGDDAGECMAGGIELGAAMVARGWAFAYRRLAPAYQSAEAFAQAHALGLWNAHHIEKPWEWRTRHHQETGR